MVNRVRAEVTKRNLIITPTVDGSEVADTTNSEFDVTVTNESQEFTSFQLELSTPGVNSDAIEEWYKIEPEICTKKPPGASTTFRVAITRSPLPVYETAIDLLLRVFSIEHRNLYTTQKLNLTIKKPRQPLNVVLPNKEFKASPGDRVDIPVLVYNYSPTAVNVTLQCSGLETNWLNDRSEQKIRVEPSYPTKATFSCHLPDQPQLLSQSHPFTIEALSEIEGRIPTEKGVLEILPLGAIEFHCTPKRQQIPAKRQTPSDPGAAYQIELKNASNLSQQVKITTSEQSQQQCALVLPQPVTLAPGETIPLVLASKKQRHWIGFKQQFQFDVQAEVLELNWGDDHGNGSRPGTFPDRSPHTRIRSIPSHHTLELHVLPIIHLLLLLTGGVLLLVLALLNWFFHPQPQHTGTVNSVRLDGNASTVFSGSSDQTILRWQVNNSPWQIPVRRLQYETNITAENKLNKAVRVIRLNPADNNVIAAGLDSGEIQLLDVLGNQVKETLFQDNDRVFDLDFTPDSKYLFSGHGSSRIRQWDWRSGNQQPIRTITTDFAISSLAVYQSQPEPWIIIGGRYNTLMLWDWSQQTIYQIPYQYRKSTKPSSTFAPISSGQHQYINTVATSNHLLVTGDSQGYITIWDLKNPQCELLPKQTIQVLEKARIGKLRKLKVGSCNPKIRDQWIEGHAEQPVRSVAITQDSQYLASVGDDGRVMLWFLKNGERSLNWKQGKSLANFSDTHLHSVDIKVSKVSGGYIFVTSDAPQNQVRLYRESMNNYASQP